MKKKSIKNLKSKLDSIFSQYIRLRDSHNGYANCFVCGKLLPTKQIHCGHYISRRILATRYDERNCNAECPGCNLWKNQNIKMIEHRNAMIAVYGEEVVKELESKIHSITKLDRSWYEEKIKEYEEKVEQLKAEGKFFR